MIQSQVVGRRMFMGGAICGTLAFATMVRAQRSGGISIDVTAPPFNADPTGARNSTRAFSAASQAITAAGSGDLIIPAGTYRVGSQRLTGRKGKDWAFEPEAIILIQNCSGPVNIIGNGARLVCEEGLRFGSFNPVTGSPATPRLPFVDTDFRASPYVAMVALYRNSGVVSVSDLELDGNIGRLRIGGGWNDAGIQIGASGIEAYGNASVRIENVFSHHHGLDGIMIGYSGLRPSDPPKPHSLSNCRFEHNGRQGLSWVGGNSLRVRGCRFSDTGRGGISSSPGAGVDIEAEQSICRDGVFEDCHFANNGGVGFVTHAPSDNADITCRRCTFVGTTTWSAWPANPGMVFEDCIFAGAMTNPHADRDPRRSTRFIRCRFSADRRLSERGKVYWQNYLTAEVDGGENVLFDGCTFESGGNTAAGLVYLSGSMILRNCRFRQDGGGLAVVRGIFEGRNEIVTNGTVDFSGARFRAPVMLNGSPVGA